MYKFELFIAGDTQNSAQALSNLTAICRHYLPDAHVITVVDVFSDPAIALTEGIFMTPTLMRRSPSPVKRIVGTLSDTAVVLNALGIEADHS